MYHGHERRRGMNHTKGYRRQDIGEQMGKGALIACGFIVLCVIIYTALHYAGVA